MRGVSVIICCYNSASKLPETLAYLARQQVRPEVAWEVIVVDNASTDQTKTVATQEWAKHAVAVPLTVVHESKPGLSYARKRGIDQSKYDIVIFCDDDNGLSADYLQVTSEVFNADAKIGALGGCGFATGIPAWLTDHASYYALGPQGPATGEVTHAQGCLYGAGLALRKDVLHELDQKKFTSILSDRTGKSLMSGGDTELTFAIRLIGYKLWYDERLTFKHFIPVDRYSFRYFRRLMFYIGYSWMSMLPYHQVLNGFSKKYPAPSWADAAYVLHRALISFFTALFFLISFQKRKFRHRAFQFIFNAGELWFIMRNFRVYKDLPVFLQSLR